MWYFVQLFLDCTNHQERSTNFSVPICILETTRSLLRCYSCSYNKWLRKLLCVGQETEGGSSTAPGYCAGCSTLGPHDPTDLTVLKASVANMDAVWSLMGYAYDWLRKRKLRPGLLKTLHIMQASPRNGQLQHYNSFLGPPWRHKWRKESGKKFRLYTWSGWMFRNLERTWWWERPLKKYEDDLSKGCEDIVSHVNAHQKVMSAEEFNNQIARMNPFCSLFLHPFLSLPNGSMNKVGMVSGIKVIHGWPGYHCCWVPDPIYANILQGDQPATWWEVDYTGPLPLWKGQCFFLIRVDAYSGYGFALTTHNTSSKTTHGLRECLNVCAMVFHAVLPLTRNSLHRQRSVDIRPTILKPIGLTMFPTILKQMAW